MLILKHLKRLQHVSIIIQIIFRELVGSLLKSLNLKIFKKCNSSIVVMRQHNVWCVCVAFCVERYVGLLAVLCGEVCWTACSMTCGVCVCSVHTHHRSRICRQTPIAHIISTYEPSYVISIK